MSNTDASASPALDSAWRDYRDRIEALRARLLASPLAADPGDRMRAQRWLLQAQAASYNLVVAPRQSHPHFFVGTAFEPNVYAWLLPNADFLYRYAFLDGARRFRIRGTRGTSRFLEAQTIRGFWGDPDLKLLQTYDFDRFELANGELVVGVGPEAARDGANWIATDPSSSNNTLIVREAFWDWGAERRAELGIEPIDAVAPPAEPDEAQLVARLGAASRMMEFCLQAFSGGLSEEVLSSVGVNRFRLIDTSRDEHAANPSAGYVPAVYELGDDEALLVEVQPPRARYWSIHLGDVWWQVTDYANRQSSLNGHQVMPDADGRVRIAICARDPGIANWLDTAGIPRGVALLRWYFTDTYPEPRARRMPLRDLRTALPPATAAVAPAQRAQQVAARRAAVLRRYGQ
jgi:hypothetical protein